MSPDCLRCALAVVVVLLGARARGGIELFMKRAPGLTIQERLEWPLHAA